MGSGGEQQIGPPDQEDQEDRGSRGSGGDREPDTPSREQPAETPGADASSSNTKATATTPRSMQAAGGATGSGRTRAAGSRARAERRRAEFDALDLRPVSRWLHEAGPSLGLEIHKKPELEFTELGLETDDWRFHRAERVLRLIVERESRYVSLIPRPGAGSPAASLHEQVPPGVDWNDAEALNNWLRGMEGPIGQRIRAVCGAQPLRVQFELRVHRRELDCEETEAEGTRRVGGAPIRQVSLDQVDLPLEPGEPPARLHRVTIDSNSDGAGASPHWFERMRIACRLRRATSSVYEAARLAHGLTPPAAKPPGLTLSRSMTVGEVAFAVLRQQFHRCLAHEPGTRLGDDIEQLHDMRVASRRMRAAIQLFEAHLPLRMLTLRRELAWLGGALGEVRDLDVQIERAEQWAHGELSSVDAPALQALIELLQDRRVAARRRMLRALDSKRFDALQVRVERALAAGPPRTAPRSRLPILQVAPSLIEARYKFVQKRGQKIRKGAAPNKYHRLRISFKSLRYALEFHRSLYGEPALRLIRVLTKLQDILGEHQDADVACEFLRETVQRDGRKLPGETLFAMGLLVERYGRRMRKLRRQFRRSYPTLHGKRWRELHEAMAAIRPTLSEPPPTAPPADGEQPS